MKCTSIRISALIGAAVLASPLFAFGQADPAVERSGPVARTPERRTASPAPAAPESPVVGQPLDIKFTAVDGREVDLAKMKGKVVLIDFWATWCGPCIGELPHVLEAYEKFHPQGFEIVGISFDQDKGALERLTKQKGMTWPQYFDGAGWKNTFGQRFGIRGIPTMWLVDKEGKLATRFGRSDLATKVEALLAGKTLAADPPSPARRPAQPPPSLDFTPEQLATLPTLQSSPSRKTLEKEIAIAAERVKRFNRGFVTIGQIVLDGPGDVRSVQGQMRIIPGGYFATETGSLERPIAFRLHGFEPLDASLAGKSGSIVDLGVIKMKSMAPGEGAVLRGRVELEGGANPELATLNLVCTRVRPNTPSGGVWPSSGPAEVRVPIAADGTFSVEGCSPTEYYFALTAPGYVRGTRFITPKRAATEDLGTLHLYKPRPIELSYIVAPEPRFALADRQTQTVQTGDRWKAGTETKGSDLVFDYKDGRLVATSNYGPCGLLDLGEGSLENYLSAAESAKPTAMPYNTPVERGHTYLLKHTSWNHWVLFTAQVK